MLIILTRGETYGVLKNLLAPALHSTKTYKDMKKALIQHYSPKRSVIAKRYNFYVTKQEPKETIKDYGE